MAEAAGDKATEEPGVVEGNAKPPVERIGCRELVGAAVLVVVALIVSLLASTKLAKQQAAITDACRQNLLAIQAAKTQYVAANGSAVESIPVESDLLAYMGGATVFPACPGIDPAVAATATVYQIGSITTDPVCVFHPEDHSLQAITNQ